jgi:sulfite exporter TauE/SafE
VIELLAGSGTALWLGVLTSINPCPLATNAAAVSFIGRKVENPRLVLWASLLYTCGRSAAYVALGMALVLSLISAPRVSHFLQKYMIVMLGPFLLACGLVLLGLVKLPVGGMGVGPTLQDRAERMGIWGAGFLGIVFALAFCPLSAALFFGSLLPLAVQLRSGFLLPFVYGVGTALPVVLIAILIAGGAHSIGKTLDRTAQFALWARRVTGIVFVAIGVWFSVIYTLPVLA